MRKKHISTHELIVTALFIALTYIATAVINIRLPISANGGLIHLGSVVLVVAAYLLTPLESAISVSLGMSIFDAVGPYAIWTPATFAIRFIQTYFLSKMVHKNDGFSLIIGIVVSCLIEMVGYYVWEAIIYGNWITPMTSMPSELLHNIVGFVAGIPLALALKKAMGHKKILKS